ncbi:hypothetical protein Goshw_011529 [Gossypium schwendimanii]|uniref:GOLD domain-containing protein n=1 Tax=Gossypium schwendimanii TaxID=34291 RepID=A0A7J9L950_GOSSC|nr:hypothetical protein [Gossypium schwendimanii]
MSLSILTACDLFEIKSNFRNGFLVSLTVESINSYIAWDFSLVQGKMNMVLPLFSLEPLMKHLASLLVIFNMIL